MTIRSRFLLSLILTAVCAAQEDPSASPRAARQMPPVVTMSFAGGTMAEFVAAVRKAEPKSNIVVAANAERATLPAMELKVAGLDQVLESACAVATSEDRIQCSQSRGVGEPVFAIVARPSNVSAGRPIESGEPETIVLSLNRLTEMDVRTGVSGLRIATILSAIEAGSTFDEQKPPMMRYHEDSGLLFLRGTHRQLSLATDVLSILERDQKEREKDAETARRMKAEKGGAEDKPK